MIEMTPSTKKYLRSLEEDLVDLERKLGNLLTQFEKKHGVQVEDIQTERAESVEDRYFKVYTTVSLSILNCRSY